MNAPGSRAGSETPSASRSRAASSTAADAVLAGDRHPDRAALARRAASTTRPASPSVRAAISSFVRGPRSRSRSCTPSTPRACRPSASRCSSSSISSSAAGVQQLAQVLGAEQLAQQVAVERERGRPPFGERRVALVHGDRDPPEQQRLRERRGALGVDRDDPRASRAQVAPSPRAAPARRRCRAGTRAWSPAASGTSGACAASAEQVGAALALLPQRRALARAGGGAAARRARAGLAEDAGEHARVPGSASTTASSISSGSNSRSRSGCASTASGRRSTMPSSLHSTCAPGPNRSISRASIASAHGACTREPNGERMQTRQSPSSSRNRSTTTVRSSGTAPVASACSSR